jgi:predicted RNase H-like nuclease (RuvC/YqgF family)
LEKLEAGIVKSMKRGLIDQGAINEAVRAFRAEKAEQQKRDRVDVAGLRKQLARNQVEIDRVVSAIADIGPQKELKAKLVALDAERDALADKLRQAEAESNVVQLHPKAVEVYRTKIENLHAALIDPDMTALEKRASLRDVVDHIVVHPTEPRQPYEFTPYARGLAEIFGIDEAAPGKTKGKSKTRVLRSRQVGLARLGH